MAKLQGSIISGTGMYVPEQRITNEHFATYLDTSDEWITSRTGISERRWAPDGMTTCDLAEPAAQEALRSAGISPAEVDGVIVATATPDYAFPSIACLLQQRLGLNNGIAFDLNAACTGFVYALSVADSLIRTGAAKNLLVVGAEIFSRIIDHKDRSTCVLFGDGAGAVVLSAGNHPGRGVMGFKLCADGSLKDILHVPMGMSHPATPESISRGEHFLQMNGREVFKVAVRSLNEVSEQILEEFQLTADDVDLFVSHQANKRILDATAKHLGVPGEKVLVNVQKYGNTSAASLPILIAECVADGTIQEGQLILLSAFGGGATWGSLLMRW